MNHKSAKSKYQEIFNMKKFQCPKCGSDLGYYTNEICSYAQLYDFEGMRAGSTEPRCIRGGKLKYCRNCHKNITESIDKEFLPNLPKFR